MTSQNPNKLKKLLRMHIPGTVELAPWLERHDISRELQSYYRKSGWLDSVGTGALKREGEKVTWLGGLYAMQTQANQPVHAGALTALSMQGHAHFIRMRTPTVFLFAPPRFVLPAWFRNATWGTTLRLSSTSLLPFGCGLEELQPEGFPIRVASPERAMFESLYLAPETVDLVECFHIMEGLTTLRPTLVRELLTQCSSIKVKRLFLYLAAKANHAWLKRIDTTQVVLGKGDRSITKGGVYISEFGITIPRELAAM